MKVRIKKKTGMERKMSYGCIISWGTWKMEEEATAWYCKGSVRGALCRGLLSPNSLRVGNDVSSHLLG